MRSFLLTSVNTKNFLEQCSKLPRRVKIDFNSLIKSYMNIQESYWSYNILGETFSDSLVIYGNSKNTIDKITFNRIELKKKMRLIYNANTDLELISKVEELKQQYLQYAGTSDLETYSKDAGYESEDDFVKQILEPNAKIQLLQEKYVEDNYYKLDFSYDNLVKNYKHIENCQESVPQSLFAFLISNNYEDCLKSAISMGGDADTMACIAGGIAAAYYGVPKEIENKGLEFLPNEFLDVLKKIKEKD